MKQRFFLTASALIAVLLVLVACDNSESAPKSSAPPVKLSVGIQTSPAMALVMVAQDKGFFKDAGLDVTLTQFTAGKFAMQAFLGGSLDVAITGDVPVALATLQGNRFRVVAQVVEKTTNEVRVVARADGFSADAKTYFLSKKRKLATSIGGGPEFYTYSFMRQYGIDSKQVEIISQRPEDMPASLSNGSVDAIAIFDPFAAIAERNLGSNAKTFTNPTLYSELYVVNAKDGMLTGANRAKVIALLKGLRKAQDYVAGHADEAKTIVIKYTKLDRAVVDAIWQNYSFKVALTQALVDDNVAEARWAIQKGTYPPGTPIPNFAQVVERRLLMEVAPDQVNVH